MQEYKKKVIGVFPTVRIEEESHPYHKRYEFIIHYSHKIYECGAIPIGLVLDNGHINEEQLALCDAFLLPGGQRIDKSVYELLIYAYKNKKPILGICMGMQTLTIFSIILDNLKDKDLTIDNVLNTYYEITKNDPIITKISNGEIHDVLLDKEPISKAHHKLEISENSLFYKIYNSKVIDIICLHNYQVSRVGSLFNIVGKSPGGVIEAIESTNKDLFWIGTQFHPETNPSDKIVKYFIDIIGDKNV